MQDITLKQLQKSIKKIDTLPIGDSKPEERYFIKLVEEVGELGECIRKDFRMKDNSIKGTVEEELYDVLYYVACLANTYDIDLQNSIILKEELKDSIDEITTKIEEMQNLGFESEKEIEKLNSNINVAETKILNNTENTKQYQEEIVELEEKIETLKQEIKQKQSKKDNLKQNKEQFENELKEKEEELKKLTEKLSSKEIKIEKLKKQVEENIDKKYELQAEISTQTANIENAEKRQKQIQNEVDNNILELDRTRMKREDIVKSFNEIESERNKILKSIEEIDNKREEISDKIKEYDSQIVNNTNVMRMKQSRYNFLIETEKEKEGYIKSVKLLLIDCEKIKELGKGMHGVLANIISVPSEYETAIEMCLGASLQNIVTDTEQDAKKLIEYLRNNNLGRASFLPIASVKGKKLDKVKLKSNGVIGIASDLVKYNKKYEQIILNLLGRTVVVDEMNSAINLAKGNNYSFRIVTLKGDIINPSGAITGGSVPSKTVNLLGRSREIEDLQKEISNLEEKKEKLEKEKENYINSIQSIIKRAEDLEQYLKEIEITYATEKQKMISVEEKIENLEKNLKMQKEEIQKVDDTIKEFESRKESLKNEITNLESQIDEYNKQITEFAQYNKDNQKYVDDLNFDITNLKISVSSFDESGLSIEEMITRINQDIDLQKSSINNKIEQTEQMRQENKMLKEEIIKFENEIEEVKLSVQNSTGKIDELKEIRTQKNQKLSNLEKEITQQFNVIEDIKEQCVKMNVKKTNTEQSLEEIINKLWEEYEITPNNAEEYPRPENIAIAEKEVKSIRNQIRDLGSINIDSIEEYKKTKERYDFMCEQRLDLDNTAGKLRKVIQSMTETMKNQFSEKFKQINKNFGEVFVELFGGGKAELILNDENDILECGIDIKVQPPGKKLQNMMLLSGGEKAFTAIALLFAILKINPAPFCVLDEIEAALDDVNVYRYAEYLKKFSNSTQFLVITHRKGTMEAADTVYGITMEESGISKLLSMKLSS